MVACPAIVLAMDQGSSPTVALAVAETLSLIAHGRQPPGSRLPGERALADSFGVSRTTVRAALRRLEHEGAIEGHPQRGWYVRESRSVSDRSTELESFTEVARSRGFTATSRVLVFKSRVAAIDEAETLEIAPASAVIEITRLRKLDGIPICIDSSVLVGALCDGILAADMESDSLYESLQRFCGVTVYRSTCTLQARKATEAQAGMLELVPGDPVLEVNAKTSTLDGSVVLSSVVVYRGDSYRFQAELFRSTPFS